MRKANACLLIVCTVIGLAAPAFAEIPLDGDWPGNTPVWSPAPDPTAEPTPESIPTPQPVDSVIPPNWPNDIFFDTPAPSPSPTPDCSLSSIGCTLMPTPEPSPSFCDLSASNGGISVDVNTGSFDVCGVTLNLNCGCEFPITSSGLGCPNPTAGCSIELPGGGSIDIGTSFQDILDNNIITIGGDIRF